MLHEAINNNNQYLDCLQFFIYSRDGGLRFTRFFVQDVLAGIKPMAEGVTTSVPLIQVFVFVIHFKSQGFQTENVKSSSVTISKALGHGKLRDLSVCM